MRGLKDINYLSARSEEIQDAARLIARNVDKGEWNSLDSNLNYIIAKAEAMLTRLYEMETACIKELDKTP